MTTSYKISSTLFLVKEPLNTNNKATSSPASGPTNHIAVIDCSGSMYYDLPKIRQQFKNKLPKLLGDNDTVSIVWFSGRGQFGTLLEGQKVAGLTDLQQVNAAIDKWLKPVFLTGFKEPLEEVTRLIDRVGKQSPGAFSLFFMSDGCDNQWQRNEILDAVDRAAGGLNAATFVEYGYYADRPLLTAMAERAGGQLIFSEGFDRYDAVFEAAVTKKVGGAKKVEVQLPNADFIGGIAWSLQGDGDLVAYGVEGDKITVPADLDEVFFLSPSAPSPVGDARQAMESISKEAWGTPAASGIISPSELDAVYAGISLFAVRMRPEIVKPLLKASGDVAFIEQFANCFGKQKYSEFMDAAKQAAFKSDVRFTKGWDPNKVPKDDAFTVLGMLQLLASDDENRVLLNHEKFSYSAIGRGRVDSNTVLTKDEQDEIMDLQAQLGTTKDPKEVAKISARITEISDKPEALTFVEDPVGAAAGYPISSLTFNENRPNVSILVKKEGTVDLSSRTDRAVGVPEVINTHIHRNYTIIKDGIVNVETLPVAVSAETWKELEELVANGDIPLGAVEFYPIPRKGLNDLVFINLSRLPVINAQMVKTTSAKALFTKAFETLAAKGAQKVYNAYLKEKFPGVKGEGWKKAFGEDETAWLKEQGLTEHNGFSPKSVQADATDFYYSKELKVSLKGLSSLPTLKKVQDGIAKGKLTASAQLMAPGVNEVEDLIVAGISDDDLKAHLEENKGNATADSRRLMFEIAQIKFSVILGQVWFSEFASLDENTMDLTVAGTDLHGTVEMKQVEIKI